MLDSRLSVAMYCGLVGRQTIRGLRSFRKQACVLSLYFYHFFDCQSTDLEPHRSTSLLVVCAGNSRTSHGVQDAVLTLVKPLRQAFFLMKHKSPYPCQSQENPILLDAMRRSAADDLLWNLPGMLQQRRGWR